MSKKIIFLILVLIGFWGAARFTHFQTKGFRLSKLKGNTSCLPFQTTPPSEYLKITQKFRYLGRGIESFSFLSEDGTTVLKLFNNRYQRRLFWLRLLPGIAQVKKSIAYTEMKWKRTFESYDIAFSHLKDEAGLLYYHPFPTDEKCPIILIDTLNIEHPLDLSQIAFVLQKRATLAYPYLENADLSQAREALFSLVALLKKKMDLGIADRDPLIRTNFGFCDGKAMQIDIGPLSLDSTLKNLNRQKEEIGRITRSLKHWMENQHPELIPLLETVVELSFCRFSGSFEPIFDSSCRGNIKHTYITPAR